MIFLRMSQHPVRFVSLVLLTIFVQIAVSGKKRGAFNFFGRNKQSASEEFAMS